MRLSAEDAYRKIQGSAKGASVIEPEISSDIKEVMLQCKNAGIRDEHKTDYLRTLEEADICLKHKCLIAFICLSGRLLELTLKILIEKEIGWDNNYDEHVISGLIKKKKKEGTTKLYSGIKNTANIIKEYRNSYVHHKSDLPVPSLYQAKEVFYAIKDTINRVLSKYQG